MDFVTDMFRSIIIDNQNKNCIFMFSNNKSHTVNFMINFPMILFYVNLLETQKHLIR